MTPFRFWSSRPNVGIRTSSHGRIVIGPRRNAYSQSCCTRAPSGVSSRRTERRLGDELEEIAAVAFDDVAAHAVAPVHEGAALDQEVAPRRLRRHRRRRLDLALEAHDRRQQPLDLLVGELEVRHPQLLERLQDASLVEDSRIVQLGPEPADLRAVRDVVHEREIEPRDELAAFFRQLGADRLRLLEALDLVAAEAAVAVDDALPELELLARWRRASTAPPSPPRTASPSGSSRAARCRRPPDRASPWRHRRPGCFKRRQVRRDVGHLRVGQAQVGHVGLGVVVLRIAYPVVTSTRRWSCCRCSEAADRRCGAGRPRRASFRRRRGSRGSRST